MKKIRKMFKLNFKKVILVLFLSFLLITPVPTKAQSTEIHKMTIYTTLKDNGDAHIKEIWQMDVHEGTEVYKVMKKMKDKKIQNLKVSDEKGTQYENIGAWDVDASREEKRNKCGLVKDGDSYELCFGIGDYGQRTYTFEYDVTHFVEQFENDQGFNFAFFSQLKLDIDEVKITIESPTHKFNKNNSSIFAYGYEGYVVFNNGRVVMGNDTPLENGSNKMQILMRINNGTFSNLSKTNRTFDDILEEANEGSDYDDEDGVTLFEVLFIVFVVVIGFAIIIIGIAIYHYLHKTKEYFESGEEFKAPKDVNMFRDIPCNGDLLRFYALARKIGLVQDIDQGGLIGAILLKWVKDGYVVFEKRKEKRMIFFNKDGFSIDLSGEILTDSIYEERLLNYLKRAAGSNIALETGEFEKWCSNHYSSIESWFTSIENNERKIMKQKRDMWGEKATRKFLCFTGQCRNIIYSYKVKEEIEQIVGFKLFLEEMSSIDEKEVMEVKLWEDYLIFASVLGLADKVEKQLGNLYPQFVDESNIDIFYTSMMIRNFSNRGIHAAHAAHAAESGDGGSSSFGGGGSSFSGGGGGGVR